MAADAVPALSATPPTAINPINADLSLISFLLMMKFEPGAAN
jgi:hypothetical protein